MAGEPREMLERLVAVALEAADPGAAAARAHPRPPRGRTLVLAVGKAALGMASAVAAVWPGPVEGVVVARAGGDAPAPAGWLRIDARHPVPDARSAEAARIALERASSLGGDDLLLVLLSGGASSLLSLPAAGVSAEEKQAVHRSLLACGEDIEAMNTVRRHLSAVKGGRLALAAYPAAVHALIVSDVPRRPDGTLAIEAIGSGPTVGDPTTLAHAREVVRRGGFHVPPSVHRALLDPANETPAPNDPRLARSTWKLVLEDRDMVEALESAALAAGCKVVPSQALSGPVEEMARRLAGTARGLAGEARASGRPALCVAFGETSVALPEPVPPDACGGRNTALALALAVEIGKEAGVHAVCFDTDGVDGTGPHAGAFVDPGTLERMRAAGRDPAADLAGLRSATAFRAIGDLLETGPTGTNLSDVCVLLAWPEGGH